MRRIAFLCTTLVIAACGTEPSPNVVGTWALTHTLSGGGIECTVSGSLIIDASESSVAGTLSENQASCTQSGQPIGVTLLTRSTAGGLHGRGLSFTPQVPEGAGDCAFEAFDGRVSGSSMSGVVETRPVF